MYSLQFFQWADGNGSVGLHITAGSKVRLTDAASVTAHLRQHHVMFYCQCLFLQKSMESILGHFKNVSWSFKYMYKLIKNEESTLNLRLHISITLFVIFL